MERRLIDANALKEAFEEDGHLSGYIEELIDDCPTIDAVEVVRCRDCMNATGPYYIPGVPDITYCEMWNECVIFDGYCHRGERRELEND